MLKGTSVIKASATPTCVKYSYLWSCMFSFKVTDYSSGTGMHGHVFAFRAARALSARTTESSTAVPSVAGTAQPPAALC